METQEASLPWSESLRRIRTLADITEGLSLVFIFGPGHLARRGLKQVSDTVRGQRRTLRHRLDEHGADLSESLATAGGEPTVLLVHGMESVGSKRRREIAIALNTGRNGLKSFDALVVFWIPENEQEDLFRFCSDLLHWRTLTATVTAADLGPYADVETMAPGEATTLLAHGLSPVDRGRFGALARRLGEWPLLLRLVNSRLRDLVHQRGLDVSTALERVGARLLKAGLRVFDPRNATERGVALSLVMNISLDVLSPEDRRKFLDLAVFPEDVDIPIHMIERLWEFEASEAEELCRHLADYSLMDLDITQRTIRLHGAVRQYLVEEHSDFPPP